MDSLVAGGKYYASIGDHLAPEGNAFVYEYDPDKRRSSGSSTCVRC